jgi:hypothetical protein
VRQLERSFKVGGEWSFKSTISAQEEEMMSRGNDGAGAHFGRGGCGGIQVARK